MRYYPFCFGPFLVLFSAYVESEVIYRLGDVRNCVVNSQEGETQLGETQQLGRMEVLPGAGFDNLRNRDLGEVHAYNYSTCQISKDGKFILPDNFFLIPMQESRVSLFALVIDHWDDYVSMTSQSINLHSNFFSTINGKFSEGYSTTKSRMHNDNARSTNVQIKLKLYTVKIQPGAELHPVFKNRLYDIASSIQNNDTENAQYQAELLIRDYGTHYISSIDAGAILSQTDFIHFTDTSDTFKTSSYLKASASANFFQKFELNASFQQSSSQTNTSEFLNNRTYSIVETIGGPPFTPGMSLEMWEKDVPQSLVAIDRSGDPLHFVINPTTLPRLPKITVRDVSDQVQEAIDRYYKANTRRGCTSPEALNFDFQANLDDGLCSLSSTNFTFGGLYQLCTVDVSYNTEDLCNAGPKPALQRNPLTGDMSCPNGYVAINLHSGIVSHVTQRLVCNEVCESCGFLWLDSCCSCENVLTSFLSLANYEAYWCAALPGTSIPNDQGFLFGGYFTSEITNPFTGSMTCPRFFYPIHFGEDIEVCVSTDYERGYVYALDFGGFQSCNTGNPLAADLKFNASDSANWPQNCPNGYTQHLVDVEDSCEINFCIRSGSFKKNKLTAPRLPPFRKHPRYKNNLTDTMVVFGVYGDILVKNNGGGWDEVQAGSEEGKELLKRLSTNSSSTHIPNPQQQGHQSTSTPQQQGHQLSNKSYGGIIATIVLLSTTTICTIVTSAICFCYFKYRKSSSRN